MSVSLLAVAAITLGVVLSKQRQDRPSLGPGSLAGESQPAERSLDAIRAAGL